MYGIPITVSTLTPVFMVYHWGPGENDCIVYGVHTEYRDAIAQAIDENAYVITITDLLDMTGMKRPQ